MGMLQLIKDGFRVYSVLTISIFQQLNKWKSMTKREGLFFLECYEKFVSQTKLFKAWALKMVKCGLVDKEVLPDFDNVFFLFFYLRLMIASRKYYSNIG